jgi:hypothetical protein
VPENETNQALIIRALNEALREIESLRADVEVLKARPTGGAAPQ